LLYFRFLALPVREGLFICFFTLYKSMPLTALEEKFPRLVVSRRGPEDSESGFLFGDEFPEAGAPPAKPVKERKQEAKPSAPAKPVVEEPGSRKSVQDFEHEGSVGGLRAKYEATSQGIIGFDDSIFLPNGEEVDGVWKLVDAFSITPSHDPFTFTHSRGFPALEGGGSVNTRDYSHESDAKLNVINVAGDFDGRALGFDSAVVVTKDGVVISGNNRTMSSQLAARKGTDKKYLQALLKRCRSFGFTQDQVMAFEHPRVVFEIDSDDYSPEHFDKYNANDKKEQTEEARIVKFTKTVKPAVLKELAGVYRRYQFDFGQVYANPGIVQEVMNIFIQGGVLSQIAVSKYFDGNKISASGKEFIREYTLGAVLTESVVHALYDEGMGNVKETLLNYAPLLLENWSMGSYAVVGELNKAVEYAIAYLKDLMNGVFVVPKLDKEQAKTMSAGDKLAHNLQAFGQWAQQGDLFEAKDPVVLKLAGSLVYSAPLFKSYLEKLNVATASAAALEREDEVFGGVSMFGDLSPDRHGLLEKAVAAWNRRAAAKRNILSSVLFEGGNMIQSGIIDGLVKGVGRVTGLDNIMKGLANLTGLDLKSRIMKWTSASPENRQAWQKALQLFQENFGHGPKSEKDAKLLMKTAYRMLSGEVFSGDQFKQEAKEELTGQGQQGQGQQAAKEELTGQGQQGQGQQGKQGRGGSVSVNDPTKLFEAIRGLYKSGKVSKDQLIKAFQVVVSSLRGSGLLAPVQDVSGMSPLLREHWDQVKVFSSRLRSHGISDKGSFTDSLEEAFSSWMTPELAGEAYRQFAIVSGMGLCRFKPLTVSQRREAQHRDVIGSSVVYRPLPLGAGAPAFLAAEHRRFSGQTGRVVSINSEIYNVEMPGEEVVSAVEDELEFVGSARPPSNDPVRETVREFLSNVGSLSRVPNNQMGIMKEVLEPSHVVYMHTETLPNGKPYTVEFHVVPGDPDADVYVVRDFDNHPLEEAGFQIEDLEDWNLSEVDHVDALFAKEMARTGFKDEGVVEEEGVEPSLDGKQYTFDRWFDMVDKASSGLRRPSKVDTLVCSAVHRLVSGVGYRKTLYPISSSFIQSKIVYHGTPNKVGDAGEFSTSFIGTGEGRQAFGWGLYFAENRKIAEAYHEKLSGGGGHVYEVDIKVPDEYFLVEDYGWEQQSEYVRNCLLNASNNKVRNLAVRWSNPRSKATGHKFLVWLYYDVGGGGSDFSNVKSAKKESLLLREAGIHGYKFLDGYSRGSGEGSFNYIVIDENDIETVQHQVKDDETGQVDLFTQEQYVQPARRRAAASFSRFLSSSQGGEGSLSSPRYDNIPSGVQAFLNRTLDFADKLTKRPLSVVDEVAALPAKAVDKVVDTVTKKKTGESGRIESKIAPIPTNSLGHPAGGKVQVGVTSWVGMKLYHGFRAGYFDATTYDPDFSADDSSGGEHLEGFWATPSFALAKTFGKKGGVVECYLDVKRALTFNLDALTWLLVSQLRPMFDAAGIDYNFLKDSKVSSDIALYNMITMSGSYYAPSFMKNARVHLYEVISMAWDLFKLSGYDGVCMPEKGVPTVAAMDFSQVTYGEKVTKGSNVTTWDGYDASPLWGPDPKPPASKPAGPVAVGPSQVQKGVVAPEPKTSPVSKAGVSKSKSPVPKAGPKADIHEGPDPRFKEGELFASWRRRGVEITPLFFGNEYRIMSMRDSGFTRNDIIENLRKQVPVRIWKMSGLEVSWDFGTPRSVGGVIQWESVFSLNGHRKSVLFKEGVDEKLSVYVDGVLILGPILMETFKAGSYKQFIRRLMS
jgi:hypothetical protein